MAKIQVGLMLFQLLPAVVLAQDYTADTFSMEYVDGGYVMNVDGQEVEFILRGGDFSQEVDVTEYGLSEVLAYNSGEIVYEINAGDLDVSVQDGALVFANENGQVFTRPVATLQDNAGELLGSAQYQIVDKIIKTTKNFNPDAVEENRDGYKLAPDGYYYQGGVAYEYRGGTYVRVNEDWNNPTIVEGEDFGERDFTEYLEEEVVSEAETSEGEITEDIVVEEENNESAEEESDIQEEIVSEELFEEDLVIEEEIIEEEVVEEPAEEINENIEGQLIEEVLPDEEIDEEEIIEEEVAQEEVVLEGSSEEEINEEQIEEEVQAEDDLDDLTVFIFGIQSAYAQELTEESTEEEIVAFEESMPEEQVEETQEEEIIEEEITENPDEEIIPEEEMIETEIAEEDLTEEFIEEEVVQEEVVSEEPSEEVVEQTIEDIEQAIVDFEEETTTTTYIVQLNLGEIMPAQIIMPTVVYQDKFIEQEAEVLVCANPALYAELFSAIASQTEDEQYVGLEFTSESIREGEAIIKTSERALSLSVEEVSAGGDLLEKAKQNLENKKTELQNESDHFLVDALVDQVVNNTQVAKKLEESVAGISAKLEGEKFTTNANGRTMETSFDLNSSTVEKEIKINNSYSFDVALRGIESYCQSVYSGANGDTKVYASETELITYTQTADNADTSLKEWIYALKPNNNSASQYDWDFTLTSSSDSLEFAKQDDGSVMLYYVQHSTEGDTLTSLVRIEPLVYFTAQGEEKQADYVINGSTLSIVINESAESYPMLIDPTFTLITSATGFSGRSNHASMVYNNRMWVMGGYNGSSDINDVWSSADGITWTRATSSAGWGIRSFATGLVYNNLMWVIGGDYRASGSTYYNSDVWYSSNGSSWTQATSGAAFGQRSGQAGAVFNGMMWIVGGRNSAGTYLNDVWYSANGVNWYQATSNAGFGGRTAHEVVVYDNKLWVVGGYNGSTQYTDVWYSSNGSSWTRATASMALGGRDSHTLINYDGKMWLFGGYNGSFHNDVWSSTNGATWTQEAVINPFSARDNHQSVVFNNKIWVIAGKNGSRLNDAWSTQIDQTAPTISDISANSATAQTGSTVRFYVNATDTGGSGLNISNAIFYLRVLGSGSWDRVNGAVMSWDAANSRYYYDIVLNDPYNTGYRAYATVYDNIGYSASRDENPTEFVIANTPAPISYGTSPADNGSANGNGSDITLSTGAVVDADGQAVEYLFRVATGADAETGVVCDSGWQAGTTYDCNPGEGTFYWHVYTRDTVETTNPGYVYNFVNNYQPVITDNQAGDDTVRNAAGTTYDVDFADATLGIDTIEYSLGTASGLTDIAGWTELWAGDGASYTTDFQINTALLAQGRNYVNVRATDLGGLTTTLNAPFYIEWDTVGPNAPVVSSASPTNDTTPTWTWVSGGNGGNGTYRYKLDDNDMSAGTTETALLTYTSGVLAEGDHTLYVQERDAVGNWSAIGSRTVNIDTTAPNVTLSYSANPAGSGNLTITATFDDTLAGTPQIAIDQQGTTDLAATNMTATADPLIWTYTYLVNAQDGGAYVDGVATVTISNATDDAGNALATTTNPTFTIDTTSPIINSGYPSNGALLPISPDELRFNYSDNAMDVASILVRIDLTGDTDYDDPGEDLTASCTTLNATDAVCPLGVTLLPGRHQVYLYLTDTAGNTTTYEYPFWVDNFSFTVEHLNADLGTLSPAMGSTTADDTEHTLITVTTYGAGVDVQALANGQLTNTVDNVPWHANNTAVAGSGSAYRVKETAAGAFGNYFNFNDQPTAVSKAKLADGAYGALLTYTFYVEHYAQSAGNESSGNYTQNITFSAALTY